MRTFDRREALGLAALLGTSLFSLSGCESGEPAADATSGEDAASDGQTDDSLYVSAEDDPYATGVHHATIEVEGYGTIEVALNANVAPITVSNFCNLAEEGFYDGLTFHRIIEGFMLQGGDPSGDGTGGSETTIKGEFSDNGVENPLSHTRGAISMARSDDYDSASSQFFIVQEDSTYLDGSYAAFGYVTEGMDVVDAICADAAPIDSNGLIAPEAQPVITSITILEEGGGA